MSNFTPQQIEEFLQEFFDVVGARQYVGARYVPIFGRAGEDTVEWDDGAPYEPLTVVMHEGISYVSRRYVPAGIYITNTDYWVETYRFNAQVEQYRQEVLTFQGQIDSIRSDMESDYVPFPDTDHYSKYGTEGQVLSTLADGTTKWEDPVVPSDEQAETVITSWLDDHPEATTTVQDGAITRAKLNDNLIKQLLINSFSYTGTDADEITASGLVYCSGSVAHLPSAVAHVIETVNTNSGGTARMQVATRWSDGDVFYRKFQSNAWGDWTQVTNDPDWRLAFNAVSYPTLGAAIRNQSGNNNRLAMNARKKVLHQYALTEAVQVYQNKIMNSNGTWSANANFDSYVFPLFDCAGYVWCTNNWSMCALNYDLSFAKSLPNVSASNLYRVTIDGDYPYFIIPVPHTASSDPTSDSYAIRFSSFDNTTGYFDTFNLSDTHHLEFVNDYMLFDTRYDLKFKHTSSINVVTGKKSGESSSQFMCDFLYVRKGTRICSMYDAAQFNIRAIDAVNGYFFINFADSNRNYTFERDAIVALTIGKYAYVAEKMPNHALRNDIQFVAVIPPYQNKWKGRQWYAYGTSITDIGTLEEYDGNSGSIGNGNNGNSGMYPLMIDALGEMTRHNGAIGSGGIVPSQTHGGNVKTAILSCPATADLVTLEIGPNDPWSSDEGIGDVTDTTDASIMGNLYQCLDYLVNNVNGVIVVLLVQGLMYQNNVKMDPTGSMKQKWNLFKDRTKEMCQAFKVPCIDADSEVINFGKNSTGVTLVDQIHDNYFGGAMIGRYIWKRISDIDPYFFPL